MPPNRPTPHPTPGQPGFARGNAKKRRRLAGIRSMPRQLHTQKVKFFAVALIIVLLGVIAARLWVLSVPAKPQQHSQAGSDPHKPAQLPKESPGFKTLLPAGRDSNSYGGWTRVSPEGNEPVYAYAETISNVKVIVSQQQLPKDFLPNTAAKVEELAKGYHADRSITAGGTTVHIGTTSKGQQSLIFTKNGLLVLMTSVERIDDATWTAYIESLR